LVSSAQILQSPTEYKHWLLTYVRRLTMEGHQLIVQEICNELQQGIFPLMEEISKDRLLKEIFQIITSHQYSFPAIIENHALLAASLGDKDNPFSVDTE
jgi:Cdc6-like AAA superfamily ATPase